MSTYTLRVVTDVTFDSDIKPLTDAYEGLRGISGEVPLEGLNAGCLSMVFRAFDITDNANHIEIL